MLQSKKCVRINETRFISQKFHKAIMNRPTVKNNFSEDSARTNQQNFKFFMIFCKKANEIYEKNTVI